MISGDSFMRRSAERSIGEEIDRRIGLHPREARRCAEIKDQALARLRTKARKDGHILSAEAQLLYVAGALLSRDRPDHSVTDDEMVPLGGLILSALEHSGRDIEMSAEALAAAAATGIMGEIVARATE